MNFKELLIVNNHSYKHKIDYYMEILLKKNLIQIGQQKNLQI